MRQDYQDAINDLIQKHLISQDDIYLTNNQPRIEQVYDQFYEFANVHLQNKMITLGFPVSYIYFRNDLRINAFAKSSDHYKLIGINYGCIEQMHDFFEGKAELLEQPQYASLDLLANKIGSSTYFAFFQVFSLFIYYHEFAHLVQRNPLAAFELDESLAVNTTIPGVLRSHAYEMDADWYAASNVAIHMTQFFEDTERNFTGTVQEVSDMVSIGIAAILCYFIKSAGYYEELYFMEKKHPHPFVRISYIIVFLLNTLQPNLPEDIQLNQAQILRKGILIAEHLLADEFANPLRDFSDIFMQHSDSIEIHVNKIIEYVVNDPLLCRNRTLEGI